MYRTAVCPRVSLSVLVGILVLAAGAPRVEGINIVTSFDPNQGHTYIDPNGIDRTADLIPIMTAAASYWEDIIEDSHTLTITYWWEDMPGQMFGQHINGVLDANSREISCDLRFDTTLDEDGNSRPWFFDSTPEDNAEFYMHTHLYRNLDANQQDEWFNGSPPEVFEASYSGGARPGYFTDPFMIDLYNVALHEIGHAMGILYGVAGDEVLDKDYDIDPAFVRGATMAVACDGNRLDHIAPTSAGMHHTAPLHGRRLPSAADVLAIAAASDWTDIDLPRKDILGTGYWNDGYNWLGGRPPDIDDEAYIRLQATTAIVALSANGVAANLFVGEGSLLMTNTNKLTVPGITVLDGVGTRVLVITGGELETGELAVRDGGELDMSGGIADINGELGVQATGKITGNGLIDVQTSLINDGLIAPDGGTLMLATAGSGVWDLDGQTNTGQINCTAGDLIVSGTLNDPFDGTATVGSGRTLTFNSGWTLGSGGTLAFNGGGSTATVAGAGGRSTVAGAVTVNGTGEFSSKQTFYSSANVQVATGADKLVLGGDSVYSDGSFTGSGLIQQDGDVDVWGNTTMGVAIYDWDGTAGASHQTEVHTGWTFTINANKIDLLTDGYDGTATVHSAATLSVNTSGSWRLDGNVVLLWGTVNGSTLVNEGTISGRGTISSAGLVNTGSLVGDGGTLTVNTATSPDLDGTTDFGTIQALTGDVVIVPAVTEPFGGLVTVGPNHSVTFNNAWTLDVNGSVVLNTASGPASVGGGDVLVIGNITAYGPAASLASSTMTFHAASNVNVTNAVDALALNGSVVYEGGTYAGFGTIAQNGDANVVADTTIGVGTYDWDGAGESSPTVVSPGATFRLNVNSIDPTDSAFDGVVTLEKGTLIVKTPSDWNLDGTVYLKDGTVAGSGIVNNGTIRGSGVVESAGLDNRGLLEGAGGTLVIDTTTFPNLDGMTENGELEALSGDLRVKGDYGGLFGFNGTLRAGGGHVFSMVKHGLENNGTVLLSGGTYLAPSFEQRLTLTVNTSTSTLETAATFDTRSTTTLDADLRIVGSATVYPGATFSGAGSLIIEPGSTLSGEGEIGVNVLNRGGVGPGFSAGELTIAIYEQTSTGALEVEIGGYNSGSDFDHLIITGEADLDGLLDISLIALFEPTLSDAFEIMTFGSRVGEFATVIGQDIGNGLYFDLVYAPTSLTLVAGVFIMGDVNLSGCVDDDDLSLLLANWSIGDEWGEGDLNESGTVNDDDLSLLLANWGAGCSPAPEPVPEPATLSLLVIGALTLLRRRSR